MSTIAFHKLIKNDYSLASLQELMKQIDLYLKRNKKIKEELDNAINELEKINPVDSFGRNILKFDEVSESLSFIKKLAERGDGLKNFELTAYGEAATKLFFDVTINARDDNPKFSQFREDPSRRGEQALVDEIYSLILDDLGLMADFTKITEKIEKYKKSEGENGVKEEGGYKGNEANETIKKIIFVEPQNEHLRNIRIILNGIYNDSLELNLKRGSSWEFLYDISQDKPFTIQDSKKRFDYINSNGGNKIYKHFKIPKQKILKINNGFIKFNVKYEVISCLTWKKRNGK